MNKPEKNISTVTTNVSLVSTFAKRFNVEPEKLLNTLKATAFKQTGDTVISNEQMMSLLVVANEYQLNPFTKEIYAFPSRGGIQPIVSIDGWLRIINSHPDFDGMEFNDHHENGELVAVTCRMYRKDRKHPIECTEYMSECKRDTDTWKRWPARMLRHKATIQTARYAFGFSGIVDPDEGERIRDMGNADVVPLSSHIQLPPYDNDKLYENINDIWATMFAEGEKTAEDLISTLSSRYTLTDEQIHLITDAYLEATNQIDTGENHGGS